MAVARAARVITSPSNPQENFDNPEDVDDALVEAPADDSDPDPDAGVREGDTDISHKEFRYNPPMHPANLHLVPDLGERGRTARQVYDEGGAPAQYNEEWAKNLGTLRLGRIIQHHLSGGLAAVMDYRWGFRFLYNPTSITYAASRTDSFVIDPRSETNRVISGLNQNFQTIGLTVLLDRVPDVLSPKITPDTYSPSLRRGDKEGLRRYGTHWDLEALFRICNGEWNLSDRGKTANIGVLTPGNARLILGGGINYYGFLMSVSYTDLLFSENMVPIRTQLTINFRRHVDMSAEQAEASFPNIASAQEGPPDEDSEDDGSDEEESDSPDSGSGSPSGGGSQALANFFLTRVGDERIIGKQSVDGPASWHSVYRACIKNVTWAKRYLGDTVRNGGLPNADAVRKRVVSAGEMRSGYDAPAGALFWWNAGVGDGAGHVAVSDGRGNAINNWAGSKIEKRSVRSMAPSNYSGWSSYESL